MRETIVERDDRSGRVAGEAIDAAAGCSLRRFRSERECAKNDAP